MEGDVYTVYYHRFGEGHTFASELGPFNNWKAAKEERQRIYMTFAGKIQAVWVMRTNPGLALQPERFGEVLRRRKPNGKYA